MEKGRTAEALELLQQVTGMELDMSAFGIDDREKQL